MTAHRKKVLLIAEAVSLAHIVRALELARSLDSEKWHVLFACSDRYREFIGEYGVEHISIYSLESSTFFARLKSGKNIYDRKILLRYVSEELQLFNDFLPDIVIGDFRLSLLVSTALNKLPFINITNSYWSPYSKTSVLPLPDLPINRLIGTTLSKFIFRLIFSRLTKWYVRTLNQLPAEFGMPVFKKDFRQLYCSGDMVLYADAPSIAPTKNLPSNHHYLGPIVWTRCDLHIPPWWDEVPNDRMILYVTLGSSGSLATHYKLIEYLGTLPVIAMVATAGRPMPIHIPSNIYHTDFLPGLLASERAHAIVCNGGSPTTHQALLKGVPVIGIASNLDQHLNMSCLVERGVGIMLRCESLTREGLSTAVMRLRDDASFTVAAQQVCTEMTNYHPSTILSSAIEELLAKKM